MIGQQLGHYLLEERIGAGGMGEVYRARDRRLERDVAIKLLPAGMLADEHARKRFRREALTLSHLSHPHIATVYDFDTQEGVDFLVMELVTGPTLAEKLSGGALREKEVARLGQQVAEALKEAHEHGIIHRDLKPGNIKLTPKGQAKVLDFGLARLVQPVGEAATESLTETQGVAGTLPYMSPEQLRGEELDARSDLYALGVVLYEAATGRRPFDQKLSTTLTDAILHQPPPAPRALNGTVSAQLEHILLKCLEKDPDNRYQSAKEVAVDLRRLVHPSSGAAALPRPRPRWRRHGLVVAGVLAVVAVAILLGLNVGNLRGRWLSRGGTLPSPIRSLAVLPLDNLSGDPEQEYFADGMTETLITDLAQIHALKVISRTSVMQYKGVEKSLPQIAEELGVDAVVEGAVQREGDQVRVTAQLVDARTDEHLWAQSYDRQVTDTLALQAEVARAIADTIRVRLTAPEQARLAVETRVNPAAQEAYFHGRYYWNKRTAGDLQRAAQYFSKAIEIDPSYSLAYTGLADCYSLFSLYSVGRPMDSYPKARAAALKALELNPNLAEPHASLALVEFYYDWDWAGAEAEFKRALELNPGYANARQWYAEYLAAMGRHAEAIAEIRQAQEFDPLSRIVASMEAYFEYFARNYDQAIEKSQRVLQMDPDFHVAYGIEGRTYTQMGRFDKALATLEEGMRHGGAPGEWGTDVLVAYALRGDRGKVEKEVSGMTRDAQPVYTATVYAALGETDRGMRELERAYREKNDWMVFLKVDPRFDPLRSDPRFRDLLQRMNFPQPPLR